MRVTPQTQTRFEELYLFLADSMSDFAIAGIIAPMIEKTRTSVYMYFRQCFTGGSESYKRTLIAAMEQIVAQEVAA